MDAVVGWLTQNAIMAAAMVPIMMLLCRFFRHFPAVQHALWLVILLRLVAPPVIGWPWTTEQVRSTVSAAVQMSGFSVSSSWISPEVAGDTTPEQGITDAETLDVIPFTIGPAGTNRLGSVLIHSRRQGAGSGSESWSAWSAQVVPWLIAFWISGAMVCLLRQIRQLAGHTKIVRQGSAAPAHLVNEVAHAALKLKMLAPQVVMVSGILSPFLWCLGRIRLIWPEAMAGHDAVCRSRAIIGHELAHLRRRDHWVAWLEFGASLVWWWNPLFWFVRSRLRETAEMACDALALAAHPEARRDYAEMLLELSAGSAAGMPVAVLGIRATTPASFERRFSMILSHRASGNLSRLGLIALIAMALLALPHWSSSRPSLLTAQGPQDRKAAPNCQPVLVSPSSGQKAPPVTAKNHAGGETQKVAQTDLERMRQHGLQNCKQCHTDMYGKVSTDWLKNHFRQTQADPKKSASFASMAQCMTCHATEPIAAIGEKTRTFLQAHLGCERCHENSHSNLRMPSDADWHKLVNPGKAQPGEFEQKSQAGLQRLEPSCQQCHATVNNTAKVPKAIDLQCTRCTRPMEKATR